MDNDAQKAFEKLKNCCEGSANLNKDTQAYIKANPNFQVLLDQSQPAVKSVEVGVRNQDTSVSGSYDPNSNAWKVSFQTKF